MAQFLDYDGLLYFYQKLKSKFNYVSPATTNPVMDGTAAVGSSDNYARADHVHPTDTSRAQTKHSSSATTYGTGTNSLYGHVKLSDALDGTQAAASGGTAATPKAVSDALETALDADKEYSFATSMPQGGGIDILLYADTEQVDSVEITGKELVPFKGATASANGEKGVVPAPQSGQQLSLAWGDGTWQAPFIKSTAASGTLTLALTGASHLPAENYSTGTISGSKLATAIGTNAVARATGDASGNAIASTYAKLASPSLTGTPTAPTASAGTNSTQIATTAFVTTAVANAQSGAAMFKGTLGTSTSTSTYTQSTLQSSAYKVGWYWVVNVAGTYVGKTCGVGDMVYCVKDKGSAYAASDFTVVQNEMDAITNAQIDTIVAS